MNARSTSLYLLESNHDGIRLRLARFRAQVSIARTLAEQVEDLARSATADDVDDLLVEEMARLGCRFLEAASALASRSREESDRSFDGRIAFGPAE